MPLVRDSGLIRPAAEILEVFTRFEAVGEVDGEAAADAREAEASMVARRLGRSRCARPSGASSVRPQPDVERGERRRPGPTASPRTTRGRSEAFNPTGPTRAGAIPAVKLGRYYRYRVDAIERFELGQDVHVGDAPTTA